MQPDGTARHLNPALRVIVSAKEEENIKLFRQGGANSIVAPSTFGDYALAAAVEQSHMVQYLEDLLTAGGQVNLIERQVREEEIGKTSVDLRPSVVLRIYRGGTIISLTEIQEGAQLRQGDLIEPRDLGIGSQSSVRPSRAVLTPSAFLKHTVATATQLVPRSSKQAG